MYNYKSKLEKLAYTEKSILNATSDCVVSCEIKNKTNIPAYVSLRISQYLYRNIPLEPYGTCSIPEFVVKKNTNLYGSTDYFTSGNIDITLNVSENLTV